MNQPYFFNLYLLNKKHRRVNFISYIYIPIESLSKYNLDIYLFVLNTGGNHEPSKRQFSIQKKIMNSRYPYKTIYEIENKKSNINLFYIKINIKESYFLNFIKKRKVNKIKTALFISLTVSLISKYSFVYFIELI